MLPPGACRPAPVLGRKRTFGNHTNSPRISHTAINIGKPVLTTLKIVWPSIGTTTLPDFRRTTVSTNAITVVHGSCRENRSMNALVECQLWVESGHSASCSRPMVAKVCVRQDQNCCLQTRRQAASRVCLFLEAITTSPFEKGPTIVRAWHCAERRVSCSPLNGPMTRIADWPKNAGCYIKSVFPGRATTGPAPAQVVFDLASAKDFVCCGTIIPEVARLAAASIWADDVNGKQQQLIQPL